MKRYVKNSCPCRVMFAAALKRICEPVGRWSVWSPMFCVTVDDVARI